MVNTAETDIVSPTVAAEYPLGFLSEEVFVLHNILAVRAVDAVQSLYQLVGSCAVQCTDSVSIQPLFASCFHFIGRLFCRHHSLNLTL